MLTCVVVVDVEGAVDVEEIEIVVVDGASVLEVVDVAGGDVDVGPVDLAAPERPLPIVVSSAPIGPGSMPITPLLARRSLAGSWGPIVTSDRSLWLL